jgi:HEAT repeat protein
MKTAGSIALISWAVVAVADEGWNEREARALRQQVYFAIEHLSDFAEIKATFEKGLSNDASAATALAALVSHANRDVASTAAQMLGRFPSPASSTALQNSYATDARILVRAGALAGLARMKDPATAALAIAALEGDDEAMQGAGIGALEALGDSSQSGAILHYYDRHPDEISGDRLVALGKLGDPPGSTLVRDRLVAEANNKTNPFRLRYSAALGLRAMGLAGLVQPILDISNARNTNSNLIVLKGAMERLALTRGVTVKSQAEVDALLRDVQVDDPRDKQDFWKRPLRAKFVSQGVFHVVSDGPDMTPNTPDDLSTAERSDAYLDRVFPDQFKH